MKITNVSVKIESNTNNRLRGYASVEIDDALKITHLRIIESESGKLYCVYPSRENTVRCSSCSGKTSPKNKYCPACGVEQVIDFTKVRYTECVHPITKEFDLAINSAVLDKYEELSKESQKTNEE